MERVPFEQDLRLRGIAVGRKPEPAPRRRQRPSARGGLHVECAREIGPSLLRHVCCSSADSGLAGFSLEQAAHAAGQGDDRRTDEEHADHSLEQRQPSEAPLEIFEKLIGAAVGEQREPGEPRHDLENRGDGEIAERCGRRDRQSNPHRRAQEQAEPERGAPVPITVARDGRLEFGVAVEDPRE